MKPYPPTPAADSRRPALPTLLPSLPPSLPPSRPFSVLRRRIAQAAPGGLIAALLASSLSGCAALGVRDPVVVDVTGVEPLASEDLALRFKVTLRVQNPNDTPIRYDGVFVELSLRGSRLASGVSNQAGEVPRFGEATISLPVTVPLSAVLRQALDLARNGDARSDYVVRGKLNGPLFGSVHFESRGELRLPAGLTG